MKGETVLRVDPLHKNDNIIKENIITKLKKIYSLPRNLRAGNKSPALFLKKPLCTGDLSSTCKILIERREIFSNFVYFCPNFQIFHSFSTFLCPFSEKVHLCPYFLA